MNTFSLTPCFFCMMDLTGEDQYDNGSPRRRADVFDEEGVRRPDPVRSQRLLGGSVGGFQHPTAYDHHAYGGGHVSSLRADASHVQWLFPPPKHLSFPGSLQESRTIAR